MSNYLYLVLTIIILTGIILVTNHFKSLILVFWRHLPYNFNKYCINIVLNIKKNWSYILVLTKIVWKWIKDEDWIDYLERLSKSFAGILSIFVVLYLLFDISSRVPEAIHIDFVMISATLGGLVFTGASLLNNKNEQNKKRFLNIAKKFIIATFLFFIFVVFFTLIQDKNIKPFSFEAGVFNTILFWIAAVGIYGGSYFFSLALMDLIVSLRKIE